MRFIIREQSDRDNPFYHSDSGWMQESAEATSIRTLLGWFLDVSGRLCSSHFSPVTAEKKQPPSLNGNTRLDRVQPDSPYSAFTHSGRV